MFLSCGRLLSSLQDKRNFTLSSKAIGENLDVKIALVGIDVSLDLQLSQLDFQG